MTQLIVELCVLVGLVSYLIGRWLGKQEGRSEVLKVISDCVIETACSVPNEIKEALKEWSKRVH